ncbi:MAG: hypothetical protein DVB25_06045, partial [Verrucomicrobia bacterium]
MEKKETKKSLRRSEVGASCRGDPVFLESAVGFVRKGHFHETRLKQGLEDLVSELGAIAALCDGHQLADGGLCLALAEDFDLVLTECR